MEDYDKGDSGVTIEEIFKKANDEYWEPGEDRFIKNRFEVPAKLYEQIFGPNGPQTLEELEDIPDAETRYNAWKEQHKNDPPSNLPPFDVIDNGKEYDIFNVVNDPVWQEKFRAKKSPVAYWIETRKGRQAWLKKYKPAIPHGSRYRVYFNTPSGPLERVPAWATYVQPGNFLFVCWKSLASVSLYLVYPLPKLIILLAPQGKFKSILEQCLYKIPIIKLFPLPIQCSRIGHSGCLRTLSLTHNIFSVSLVVFFLHSYVFLLFETCHHEFVFFLIVNGYFWGLH